MRVHGHPPPPGGDVSFCSAFRATSPKAMDFVEKVVGREVVIGYPSSSTQKKKKGGPFLGHTRT